MWKRIENNRCENGIGAFCICASGWEENHPNLETDFAIFCQQEGADLEIHLYSRNVAGEISAIGCYDYDFDKIIASMGSKVCYEKENMLCARGCEGAVE